ncbi:hypothetical protein [uncultured Subdoligranulum sp.]|uniref:crAss001_48 related protein n=1 Tax=uncultured Subdoligranulum sp. TaxID=512298 RepID=UPI0026241D1A|nr:hypothetical protein [uncultured Subdoligranulum sp.]
MELMDTVRLMESTDYKDRFKAEYWQTKIRYERLKKLTTRMKAERIKNEQVKLMREETLDGSPERLLREQQACMGKYLHVLELRAVIENIEL